MKKSDAEKKITAIKAYIKTAKKAGGRFFRMEATPDLKTHALRVTVVHFGKQKKEVRKNFAFTMADVDNVLVTVTEAVHNSNPTPGR